MISRFFHNWEHRLASISKDRVVRPFEWGTDWIGSHVGESRADLMRISQAYIQGKMPKVSELLAHE